MSYLEQVQRGIDYVEAHLDEELCLAAVARAAGMSRWHFQRIFKGLTNETLMTYIRARRLALALSRLMSTDRRILDIAVDAGFESQAAFTRASKHAFGMTPGAYRRLGSGHKFLEKVQLDAEYLGHIRDRVSLEPRLERRERLLAVGSRTPFFGVDSDKNNIAETIPALWASFLPRLPEIEQRIPHVCFGVVRPTTEDAERLEYVAAAPVASSDVTPPAGMVLTEVGEGTYAIFEHRGPTHALDHTVNYIYSSWLLGSGMRHTGGADLEIYGDGWVADSDESVIDYAIPVE